MRVFLNKDERYPDYSIKLDYSVWDVCGIVEVSEELYAEYLEAVKAYEAVQKKLGQIEAEASKRNWANLRG